LAGKYSYRHLQYNYTVSGGSDFDLDVHYPLQSHRVAVVIVRPVAPSACPLEVAKYLADPHAPVRVGSHTDAY
jgi:hypothetical protein